MYSLPSSGTVNISALTRLFNSTTNSYKYLYFLSLLDIIKRRKFNTVSAIKFRDIIIEILANAWYPHRYFKLSFGTQDQIAIKLDTLDLEITEPILKFTDTDKKLLRHTISHQNIEDIIFSINRYVSYRLIRPFFEQETRGLKDYDVNSSIINLANSQFNTKKPLYCFDGEDQKNCTSIILHPDWMKYLEENYTIVRGWASWEWLNYMQQRNPSTPNVVNKLFMPQKRESLIKQTKYWSTVLTHQDITCIYSNVKLNKNDISLDHYIPWSFVAHDQLWNLIPTIQYVNSSKSNDLPSLKYFDKFVNMQHTGLKVCYAVDKKQWEDNIPTFLAELKVNQGSDLLELDILKNAYEKTLQPLISLATLQGFSPNWVYA